tara:strand:+ start:197 stop:433 length:237 start_codon:yes stop_codon:yes gene_type:complete
MMSKKHYEAMASIFRHRFDMAEAQLPEDHTDGLTELEELQYMARLGEINRIAMSLADVLAADNPRFNRRLFIKACQPN